MAARWLGGEVSEALTGDTSLLDVITQTGTQLEPAFLVRRQSEISHRAMMSQQTDTRADARAPVGHLAQTDREV